MMKSGLQLTNNKEKTAMATKVSIEEEVKKLQRHVGGMAKMFKDLKHSVEVLEKKASANENNEIKQIMDAQTVIDEILVANSDAINRINKEINELSKKDVVTDDTKDALENINHGQDGNTKSKKSKKDVTKDTLGSINRGQEKDSNKAHKETDDECNDKIENKKTKVCRYFNRGHCKYKNKCRFVHSQNICEAYLKGDKCEGKICTDRHPKKCKWMETSGGCRRNSDCDYLHVSNGSEEYESFKCESCKSVWKDEHCVVEHVINGHKCYFCLNCDDWVQLKANVFKEGWTLLDTFGNLRMDI